MTSRIYLKSFFVVTVCWLAVLWFVCEAAAGPSSHDPFPAYNSIRPNVTFWKKVYAEYDSTKGLIHDSDNLAVIYEVIDLVEYDRPGSRKINRKRVKRVKKKYNAILNRLASGRSAVTSEEKRVLALFGSRPDRAALKRAYNNIRFQRCLKERFQEGVARSGAYLKEMKRIFKGIGLPTDLVYLAHVESSFNYEAYSKFGAAGIWQFTRSTGKRFMTVDYTLDERRDPIRSTHAAARYLKENHKKLGTWPLAITAYNHGEVGVMRAMKKKGSYEKIFSEYNGGYFKFASRNFYSEFLAAREIAKNYRAYFGNIRFEKPVRSREVQLAGYLPVKELADYFQVDIDIVKKFNPALRKPVFKGQKYVPKSYRLRLPERSGRNLLALAENIPSGLYKSEQKRSRFYQVQRGDTAGLVAGRNRVKLADLIIANQLDSRATIYVGQNLRLPVPGEEIVTASVASRKSPKKEVRTAMAGGSKIHRVRKGDTLSRIASFYDVAFGDLVKTNRLNRGAVIYAGQDLMIPLSIPKTLLALASKKKDGAASTGGSAGTIPALLIEKKAVPDPERVQGGGVSVEKNREEPASETRLAMAVVKSDGLGGIEDATGEIVSSDGKQTVLPPLDVKSVKAIEPQSTLPRRLLSEVNPAVVVGNLQVEKVVEKNGKQYGIIRVEAGETLGHYAEWLKIPTRELRRVNGFRYGRPIRTSQKLKVPLDKKGKEAFEERRYEYHKEIEEDFFAAYRIEDVRYHEIKKGDNIWTLCQEEFDMPFWLIKKYNADVDFSSLMPSQKLVVPVVENQGDRA